ncbi:MAG: type I-D CRISPR-associated helicase Cas3', partial [Chloroflexi bacterium]|nr:type I-D CRISPR-associated helicase Cas3' [Chloroflexota bacterium]
MRPLELTVQPLAFAQTDEQWLPDLRPYVYQQRVYHRVAEALARNQTLCLFIATPTGSGKTLASYAYTILHSEPAFGVYPTNELIRDQERALKDWIDPAGEHRLLRIDRAQLDDWQIKLDLKCHSETLDTLLSWTPTILTNPDILFYIFFGLYGGPEGVRERLIALIGQYRLFIFDEFHLYNVKQIADVAFLVGTLHTLNPCKGRVFLFASATPDSPILPWLRERLHLPVEVIVSEASDAPQARTVAHSVDLAVVPADLTRWEGSKALLENLWIIQEFLDAHPQARLVAILDSVYGAMEVARVLRDHFPDRRVGEVHGFSSEKEREEAIRAPMTVGTSTIEVGI